MMDQADHRTAHMMDTTEAFWQGIDQLLRDHRLIIDRPRGTRHPRYPDFVYPVDYGYLDGTSAMDGQGIDVWKGSNGTGRVHALLVTLDLVKRDAEPKLLLSCTDDEERTVLAAQSKGGMHALLVRRPSPRDPGLTTTL
jgi:inorganic pyrophosphatase